MPYPNLYDVTYSYSDFQQSQGNNAFPGTQVDADLAGLEDSIAGVSAFMQNVIRSDGKLNNGIVTYDSLSAGLQTAGLAPATAWLTATFYAAGVAVVESSSLYRAVTAHTSGVFATDLAAGKWLLVTALPAGTNGTNGTNGAGYGGTSTTSLAIGTGSKVFTTQAGLAYTNGARVRASSAANAANWMEGVVTYSGTTLTMTSDKVGGSGTLADWNLNVAGEPGAGDLLAANNLSDLVSAATARANLGVRDVLTAARTYYTRTDGSDSNTGLADNAGGAFLTVQKAIDTIVALDMSIYQVTARVRAGTFTGANVLKNWVGALPPIIEGDTTTPSNVIVHTTSADCFLSDGALAWHVRGFRLRSTTSGSQLRGKAGGTIYFQNCDFGASAGNHIQFDTGAKVTATGNYSISGAPGGDGIHILITDGAVGNTSGITVTVTGTPNFAGAFASAGRNGALRAFGVTFSGSATGNRRSVSSGGVIYTGGGGDSYFPGGATGTGTNSATSPYGNYL